MAGGETEIVNDIMKATTQIYTHVDAARLVALVNSRHPLGAAAQNPAPKVDPAASQP